MTLIRFKSASPQLSAEVLRELRRVTPLSISELRKRAERGEPLLDFQVFHAWDETKRSMRRVLELIESGRLPLLIVEYRHPSGFPEREELLTPAQLRQRFEHWKQISNETQMHAELEEGYIQSPQEFIPSDED